MLQPLHNNALYLDRIDASKPIDMATLSCSGVFPILPDKNQFGFNLISDGMDNFKVKVIYFILNS